MGFIQHLIDIKTEREFLKEIENIKQLKRWIKESIEAIKKEYDNRRKILFEELSKMDDVIVREPEGAFYVLAKLPVKNAEDFAIWLLKDFNIDGETVMFAPGEGFYATDGLGVDEVRICYSLDAKDLKKAMNILKEGLIKYRKEVEK